MASEAVLKYLGDTNRPYSCADITVNLRGAFTKSAIQKALDALSESNKIKCKLYGKQKVYAAIQQDCTVEEGDLEDYDAKFKALNSELETLKNNLKTAENKLKTLTSELTNQEAQNKISETKTNVLNMEQKLVLLRNSTEVISAEEKKNIMDQHSKYMKEYRKRKRLSNDMMDAVLEGYPKSKKTFIEELCIETDEIVDFKLMPN